MVGVPCFFAELCGATAPSLCHKKNTSVLMSTPTSSRITRSTPPQPPPPPMPPLGNIQKSNNVASDFLDSAQGGSGSVDTFVDEFIASLPMHVEGGDSRLLDEFCLLVVSLPSPTPPTTTRLYGRPPR